MLFPNLADLIKLRAVSSSNSLVLAKSSNRTQGDYSSLFHGLGVEFETVRPYVIGDDVRYIDWRVTARIGKPHVKTYRAESDRNIIVVVDANAYMRFGTRVTFKSILAAKTAAIVCWQALQQQDRVGGLVFGDIPNGIQYFQPAKTDSNILRLLKTLCINKINNHNPVLISTALDHVARVVKPQSLVFIISDFSTEKMLNIERSLVKLRKNSKVILLPVQDQADYAMPDIGEINFADSLTNLGNNLIINTNNSSARKAYKNSWDLYTETLKKLGKKLQAPILWIDTAINPIKTLFAKSGSIMSWKN